MKKYLIEKLKALRQLFIIPTLPFFISRKTMIEFCEWSKQADWQDGERKRAFIDNEWQKYIGMFLDERKKSNEYRKTSKKYTIYIYKNYERRCKKND